MRYKPLTFASRHGWQRFRGRYEPAEDTIGVMSTRCGKVWQRLGCLTFVMGVAGGCHDWPGFDRLLAGPKAGSAHGEEWTILCIELDDPQRQHIVNRLAEALRAVAGIDPKAVRIEHGEHASRLYYGRYRKQADRKTGALTFPARLRVDIDLIRHLSTGNRFPFVEALPVLIAEQSAGPPEWDVHKASGPFTLQIARFFNTPSFDQRKEAAVEYVRQLRQEGFEAYYWHQDARSLVFVGNFPSAPERFGPHEQKAAAQLEADRLAARKEEFQYMTFNGYPRRTRTATGQWVRDAPLLVEVPRRENLAPW